MTVFIIKMGVLFKLHNHLTLACGNTDIWHAIICKCCLRQLVGRLIEHFWDVDGTKQPQMLLTPEEELTVELQHATGA